MGTDIQPPKELSEDEAIAALVESEQGGTAAAPADDTGSQQPPAGSEGADDHDYDLEDDPDQERTTRVDAELAGAQNEQEREAIREQRREERRTRRQRQRDRVAELERLVGATAAQNEQMARQLAALQDQSTGAQAAMIEQEIDKAKRAIEHFKAVIADATTKGDGATVAEATEYMLTARERASQLDRMRQTAVRAQQAPKPLNPLMVNHAKEFMGKHKWYSGPHSKDPDSKVLSALDNSLANEGWDPTTPAYWRELEERGKKYMPHRFAAAPAETRQNSGQQQDSRQSRQHVPVAGSSRNGSSGGNSGGGGMKLSAERVQAMKDAGLWDDPAARARMIAVYRKQDEDARNNR